MLIIPPAALQDVANLSKRIRQIFKENKRLSKRKYVGSINLSDGKTKRRVKVFAVEKNPEDIQTFSRYGDYYSRCECRKCKRIRSKSPFLGGGDYIKIYRACFSQKTPRNAVERILAHELAHALDYQRINSTDYIETPENFKKYSCDTLEFEAEMTSIEQVAVPYVLRGKHGAEVYRDLFGSKGIKELIKSKPFRTIMFNGYAAHWFSSERLTQKFFNRLVRAFYDNRKLAGISDTEIRPIMKTCQTQSRISSLPSQGGKRAAALSFPTK